MVRVSYDQKPYHRALMEAYGAICIASPSNQTQTGRAILAANPNSNGSLLTQKAVSMEIFRHAYKVYILRTK